MTNKNKTVFNDRLKNIANEYKNIDVNKTTIDKYIFLKKKLLIIATAIIGVILGGCGINLDKANTKIKLIEKISLL